MMTADDIDESMDWLMRFGGFGSPGACSKMRAFLQDIADRASARERVLSEEMADDCVKYRGILLRCRDAFEQDEGWSIIIEDINQVLKETHRGKEEPKS